MNTLIDYSGRTRIILNIKDIKQCVSELMGFMAVLGLYEYPNKIKTAEEFRIQRDIVLQRYITKHRFRYWVYEDE